jgi:hypothetical protein
VGKKFVAVFHTRRRLCKPCSSISAEEEDVSMSRKERQYSGMYAIWKLHGKSLPLLFVVSSCLVFVFVL